MEPPVVCLKCKPDHPEKHDQISQESGCNTQYKQVELCMKIHKGNIGDCKVEWDAFRICFARVKSSSPRNVSTSGKQVSGFVAGQRAKH